MGARGICTGSAKELTRQILIMYYVSPVMIVLRRRMTWMWSSLALVISLIASNSLQSTVVSPRPPGACIGATGNECGMPSGHCFASWSVFTVLALAYLLQLYRAVRLGRLGAFVGRIATPAGAAMAALALFTLTMTILMPWARVTLQAHTPAQAGWGVFSGFVTGAFCFVLALFLNEPLFRVLRRCYMMDDFSPHRKEDLESALSASDTSPL